MKIFGFILIIFGLFMIGFHTRGIIESKNIESLKMDIGQLEEHIKDLAGNCHMLLDGTGMIYHVKDCRHD